MKEWNPLEFPGRRPPSITCSTTLTPFLSELSLHSLLPRMRSINASPVSSLLAMNPSDGTIQLLTRHKTLPTLEMPKLL